MASHPQDIDQLRERLRALGYLDAPVDRYVLGSATARSGAARFALSAGVRVGLVAGLLLGISAAIALAARAPGFIASRRDAVVLAVVLSALFALTMAAAVSVTTLAASWYGRRRADLSASRAGRIAAAAGILVALACAAYLTLWWNAAQDLFTGSTFAWNAAALALAAVVSLLLAHAVSVVIRAALMRSTTATDIAAGGLLSSRGFLVAFGVILFAASGALLASGSGRGSRGDGEPITVAPTGYALRVIAIDGFDLDVSRRMKAELPAIARLLDGASVALQPASGSSPDPARDWTTIATGREPAVHGITALEARRAVGIEGRLPAASSGALRSLLNAADLLRLTTPAIASGEERRVPAFWEVASAAGLRTAVINWWATWPAPDTDDIVLTDRALLRLDTGGDLDAEIAPARLYEPLRARWTVMRAAAATRAAAAFDGVTDAELRAILIRSAEIDAIVTALANINPGPPVDLRVVYLPGLDIAQHNLLQSQEGAPVSAIRDRVVALESYYRFLDTLVAQMLQPSATHVDAAILWPGRVSGREGKLLLAGDPIHAGPAACTNCDAAVAATLLYLLGLPVADGLDADAARSVVQVDFLERHPVRRITSYEAVDVRRGVRTGQPLDAEALERLRSLGYIR